MKTNLFPHVLPSSHLHFTDDLEVLRLYCLKLHQIGHLSKQQTVASTTSHVAVAESFASYCFLQFKWLLERL